MVVPQLSKTLYRLMWNPGFSSFSTCLFSLTLSVLQTLQPRNHSYLSLALAQSSKNTEYKTQGQGIIFFLSLSLSETIPPWNCAMEHVKYYLLYCDGQRKFLRGSDRSLSKAGYSIVFNMYANVMIYDNLKTRTNCQHNYNLILLL